MANTIFGSGNLAVEQLLDDAEAVQARHLNIEEHEIGVVFADQADSLKAVLALRDDIHVGIVGKQVGELVARELFVIHDDGGQGHRRSLGLSF